MKKRLNVGVLLNVLDSIYTEKIWKGIVEEASRENVNLFLYLGKWYTCDPSEVWINSQTMMFEYAKSPDIDGIIISAVIGYSWTDEFRHQFFRNFQQSGKPLITIGIKEPGIPNITSNTEGLREALRYLISQGRQNIAFVTGNMTHEDARKRLKAYQDELKANSRPFNEKLVVQGDFIYHSGMDAARTLLARLESGEISSLDAIVASNDEMAKGVINVLRENNVRVPEDTAVLGVDDSEDALYFLPPIASVNPQVEQQGKTALNELCAMIRSGIKGEDRDLPSRFIIRASVDKSVPDESIENNFDYRIKFIENRNYIWTIRDAYNYLYTSYDLEDILKSFTKFLPYSNVNTCKIALFPKPLGSEDEAREALCRYVFEYSGQENVKVDINAPLVKALDIPPDIIAKGSNYLYWPLVFKESRFGYVIFDFLIMDSPFVYESIKNQLSIILKVVMDYNQLKQESAERMRVYEENIKVNKAMSLMEEEKNNVYRSIIHTFKNKHTVNSLLYADLEKDIEEMKQGFGTIIAGLPKGTRKAGLTILQRFKTHMDGFFEQLNDIFDYIYAVMLYQLGESINFRQNVFSNLDKACQHLNSAYRRQFDQFQIRFEYINHTNREVLLPIYEFLLEDDILRNLLTNSIRAHIEADPDNRRDDKKIWVEVFQDQLPGGTPAFSIHFRDNGPGIPPDKKTVIFEGYSTKNEKIYSHQEPESRVAHGEGGRTVKRRVTEAGGSVEETGIFGQGSDFIIVLPQYMKVAGPVDRRRHPRHPKPAVSAPTRPEFTGRRLLIVEDNPDFSRFLSDQLGGFIIETADSAELALQKIHDFQPELMTLDLELFDSSGLDVLNQLKTRGIRLPVVVISGEARLNLKELKLAGVSAAFNKPVNMDILKNKLCDIIKAGKGGPHAGI